MEISRRGLLGCLPLSMFSTSDKSIEKLAKDIFKKYESDVINTRPWAITLTYSYDEDPEGSITYNNRYDLHILLKNTPNRRSLSLTRGLKKTETEMIELAKILKDMFGCSCVEIFT